MKFKENSKGFTLVELLIVIAIIGILSTLGMVSLSGAQKKAYDAQILSDMANIRSSFILCYDNNGGSYAACTIPANLNHPPKCSAQANYVLATDVNSYTVYGSMCALSGKIACADSTGFVGVIATPFSSSSCQAQ